MYFPSTVRHPDERRDEAPVDRAPAAQRAVQLLEVRLQPLGLRGVVAQPLPQVRGKIRRVRVEEEVDLREVVGLDDAGAVGGLPLVVEERLVAHRLVGLGIAGAEGGMARVDAAVDHRPRELPARDGEQAPRRVGLDGQRRPRHRRRRLPVQAHRVDHRARLRRDPAHQLGHGLDQRQPVGLRRRRDALACREGRWEAPTAAHDRQGAHHADHPQEVRAHPQPSLHRLGPRPQRRVLGVLDRLREPALRGLVGDVFERPVFQETMPPLGHRQHDADQILEVEGRGHRGEVVHDAGQWLRRVAERQPRRRLALDGQALAHLAAHLARRDLAIAA